MDPGYSILGRIQFNRELPFHLHNGVILSGRSPITGPALDGNRGHALPPVHVQSWTCAIVDMHFQSTG